MSKEYLVEPNLEFIEEITGLGGDSVKKCFQCATCSVACPIAPENSPFPRKEMLAASWGLKDKLVGSADIWLCHECGDCSELCPRGARPGDVLSAVRSAAITEYASPHSFAKVVNDPKMLPVALGIPAVWFAFMAYITVFLGEPMNRLFGAFGIDWYHGVNKVDAAVHSKFVSTWLVDFTFVPLSILLVIVFAKGLVRFANDIHANALLEGKTDKARLDPAGLVKGIINILPTVIKHDKFNECGENKSRGTAHMLVLYGFLGCFIVTAIVFILLYLFHVPGPHSQLNPVKWVANIAGIAIVAGSFMMIRDRLAKEDKGSFKDWALLSMVMGLAATGLLAEFSRLASLAGISYFIYYLHLILVFCLIAYLPFSKMAHIVYRLVALGYADYANRK